MSFYEESYSDSLSYNQWLGAAVHQYAEEHGRLRPDIAWIVSPYDTWERNPFYIGPKQPHPESGDDPLPLTFQQAAKTARLLAEIQQRDVLIRRDRQGFSVELASN